MNLLIELDEKNPDCLYKQIVDRICDLVNKGALPVGSKLPSARDLAKSLVVSRWTVERAYEELSRLRVIQVRPAVGTFVYSPAETPGSSGCAISCEPPTDLDQCQVGHFDSPVSCYGEKVIDSAPADAAAAGQSSVQFSVIGQDLLPFSRWQAALVKATRAGKLPTRDYFSQLFGNEDLREALADYLVRARGVACNKEQVILFPGTELAYELVARLFVNHGESVVVENPGFAGARRIFAAQGAEVVSLPVDAEGMQVDKLQTLQKKPKLILVTPSRHDPTGVAMSARRRRHLLDWAHSNGCLILEDDFDNEYQYGRSVQSLQGADTNGVVIYLSSFFKPLYPIVHIGFLVVPARLVPIMRRAKALIELDFRSLEQEALAEYIRDGGFERHIRQTRKALSSRRAVLVKSIHQHFAGLARMAPATGGTHILVRFDSRCGSDADIVAAAHDVALPLLSTDLYYLDMPVHGEFLISFALADEDKLAAAVEKFALLLRERANGRTEVIAASHMANVVRSTLSLSPTAAL